MKTLVFAVAALAAIIATGCAGTGFVQPIVKDSETMSDPELSGRWRVETATTDIPEFSACTVSYDDTRKVYLAAADGSQPVALELRVARIADAIYASATIDAERLKELTAAWTKPELAFILPIYYDVKIVPADGKLEIYAITLFEDNLKDEKLTSTMTPEEQREFFRALDPKRIKLLKLYTLTPDVAAD